MNLFNRVVVVAILIVLLATTLLSMLVPKTILEILHQSMDQIEVAIPFYNIFSGVYWAYLGGGMGVILLCLLLLWLELRRPRRKAVEVPGTEGHRMEVSVKSIAQRLQSDLSGVADVSRVKPKVISRGRKVDVYLDAQVHPAVELPTKTEEITQLTREIVEEQMGIKIGKVRVNVQYGAKVPRTVPEPMMLPPVEPTEPVQPAVRLEPEIVTLVAQADLLLESDRGVDVELLDASSEESEVVEDS
jgi:uncharacterized alkaline shock family protein YloU